MSRLTMMLATELASIVGASLPGFQCAFIGGSRAMCNPAPVDTDIDVCVHVDNLTLVTSVLIEYDWDTNTYYVDEHTGFRTFRKGDYNLLVFEDAYEFGAVWGATAVGKERNLLLKSERYALFEAARLPWRGRNVPDI